MPTYTKSIPFLILFILLSKAHFAQIKLIESNYLENFNSLVKTGNSNMLPTGWLLEESGTKWFIYSI